MELPSSELCPQVEAAFSLLAKKWTGLLIFVLCEGEKHFNELKAAVPLLSSRVLALRMRELEEAGLIERHVGETSPIRVGYSLTNKGKGLASALKGIADWARN
jgi:DNA-binding HxlR family transcriptional regulator